ncbi:hypothetical protein AXK56_03970 [Tsukamurella pulmonis]|nr:hypothetical protein AXK56_03970 [Tsukamurella pulmonis]
MRTLMPDETLDLTPHPRILEVIADVDMKVPECLAELVDNSLDEIAEAQREDPGFEGRVEIVFPYGSGKVNRDSEISVIDTGRGMSVGQMRSALRAGSSGNSRFGALGLFGMGFNVATARLGTLTKVRTGRAGDDHWTIAEIDIRAMESRDTFSVPIYTEPKQVSEHGTSITVAGLKPDVVQRLGWNGIASQVRDRLGETYSYMLRSVEDTDIAGAEVIGGLGVELLLNGRSVPAYIPCIWSPKRSVNYRGQDVPAVTEVNHELKPAFACMTCGHWHPENLGSLEVCSECGSDRVELRSRAIRGWLGIQRYDDPSDFGISLLREGRTIVHLDKDLFDWKDTVTDKMVPEYPFELGRGRIVGELHLDHIEVNYRKKDFGRDTIAWRTVREKVRGEGPLQEQRAKSAGYGPNTTELGMLAHAYRRYDPGYRYLVPGNGAQALSDQARKWGEYFREGRADYQSDEMWWKNVVAHEEAKAGLTDGDGDDDSIDDLLPTSPAGGGAAGDGTESAGSEEDDADAENDIAETSFERRARYRASGRVVPQLDGTEIVVPGKGRTIMITAFITSGVEFIQDRFSEVSLEANELELFIDDKHPLLDVFGWNRVDVAVMLLHDTADRYLGYDGPAGQFVEQVLEQIGDRRIDAATVRQSAEGLLDEIREAVVPLVADDPVGYWKSLSPNAKTQTQKAAAAEADRDWNELEASGGYAAYLSPRAFEDLAVELPEKVLDGGVFTTTYGSWQDESIREAKLSHLTSLIRDLERTVSATDRMSSRELIRLSIGLESLSALVVQGASL